MALDCPYRNDATVASSSKRHSALMAGLSESICHKLGSGCGVSPSWGFLFSPHLIEFVQNYTVSELWPVLIRIIVDKPTLIWFNTTCNDDKLLNEYACVEYLDC